MATLAKADLKEKLKNVKPATPKGPAQKNPKTKATVQLEGDHVFASTDVGLAKVQIKPQRGRSTIVVLMFKGLEEKKLTQKLQLVVKDDTLPLAECHAIMRLIAQEVVLGTLAVQNMTNRRDQLILRHQNDGLLNHMESMVGKETHNGITIDPNFIATFKRNQELQADFIASLLGNVEKQDEHSASEAAAKGPKIWVQLGHMQIIYAPLF